MWIQNNSASGESRTLFGLYPHLWLAAPSVPRNKLGHAGHRLSAMQRIAAKSKLILESKMDIWWGSDKIWRRSRRSSFTQMENNAGWSRLSRVASSTGQPGVTICVSHENSSVLTCNLRAITRQAQHISHSAYYAVLNTLQFSWTSGQKPPSQTPTLGQKFLGTVMRTFLQTIALANQTKVVYDQHAPI